MKKIFRWKSPCGYSDRKKGVGEAKRKRKAENSEDEEPEYDPMAKGTKGGETGA